MVLRDDLDPSTPARPEACGHAACSIRAATPIGRSITRRVFMRGSVATSLLALLLAVPLRASAEGTTTGTTPCREECGAQAQTVFQSCVAKGGTEDSCRPTAYQAFNTCVTQDRKSVV